ncbi:hypothetical protein PMAYCL1PPCAC_08791, partial [Pristionchus mayeri]
FQRNPLKERAETGAQLIISATAPDLEIVDDNSSLKSVLAACSRVNTITVVGTNATALKFLHECLGEVRVGRLIARIVSVDTNDIVNMAHGGGPRSTWWRSSKCME